MYMDGVCYRFNGASPWHNDGFRRRAKRNWNTGIKWIEGIFGKGKKVMKYIVTHNGRAHRDEFYAVGLANHIFADKSLPALKVFRREPTEEELEDKEVLVIDVGRRHEPDKNNFDHHQFERGTVACALSLMAEYFIVPEQPDITFHILWKDTPWYKAVVLQDSLGLGGVAKKLGIGDSLPEELVSGVEIFCLQEFAKGEEVSDEWTDFTLRLIQAKIRTAIEFNERMDLIHVTHELLPFEDRVVFWAPELTPFGVNRYIERASYQAVVATITKDPRSGGICLYRLMDDLVDFSRIAEEEDVLFAHKAGFMCTVKPETSKDRVFELLSKATKPMKVKVPREVIKDLSSAGFRLEISPPMDKPDIETPHAEKKIKEIIDDVTEAAGTPPPWEKEKGD
jgi:hypothetical protein